LSLCLNAGCTVNFPEEPDTVQQDLREIGPHVIFSPPRIWEDMVSRVRVKMQDSTWLKRTLYEHFLQVGLRVEACRSQGRPVPVSLRLQHALGEVLVYSAIKDHLGLTRLRRAYTGGAAMGPDVFRFFHALGVNLKQIYGQTEVAGIAFVQRDGDVRSYTVGTPVPGTEVRISPEGEILLRSAQVFQGYYKNPEATRAVIEDGWLHTGDAGYIDEATGHLVVIDRLKDVIRLGSGEVFSPQFIENKLKFSPYIREAVCIGQDRPFVVALINIDMANVGHWAERRQIPYTTYTDLSQKPEVLALIRREVAAVNQELPPAVRIRRFVLLHKELDADDEELTRTRKVRRGVVAARYAPLIEALYDGRAAVPVEGVIRYRDGREATIRTQLSIISTEGEGEVA
ncbi:MAG: AMP-binding protein, partial [Clostridia bacterium]|nr:AMP-binding protein [Clostridia bacterium]